MVSSIKTDSIKKSLFRGKFDKSLLSTTLRTLFCKKIYSFIR